MSFGTDYSRPASRQRVRGQGGPGPQDRGMLHRLNTSLTQALYEGGNHDNGAADDFESKSVGQLRQQFATLSPTGTGRSRQSNGTQKRWNKPQAPKYTPAYNHHSDLGWTPFSGKQQQQGNWSQRNRQPQRSMSPPVNSSARPQPVRPNTAHELDTPAWAGTLRSSGGPRQWELTQAESIAPASVGRHRQQQPEPVALPAPQHSGGHAPPQPHQPKIQVMHYGPTGQQVYEQHEAPQYGDSDSARVVHLQYNTPLGLYSRENVEQALEGQTHDKAGYGTMQVSGGSPGKQFNPQNSSVLRLLAEEEAQKAGGGRGRRAGPSRQSELKQSPIIYALDATYGNGASEHQAGGMSDF